jgi:hypothetical protein
MVGLCLGTVCSVGSIYRATCSRRPWLELAVTLMRGIGEPWTELMQRIIDGDG